MTSFAKAEHLLREFKGDRYQFGLDVFDLIGATTALEGQRAALVHSTYDGHQSWIARALESLRAAGVDVLGTVRGAAPNAPREDLLRIFSEIANLAPTVIVALGGGSTLDAAKAAEVLHTLGGSIDDYFGTGKVTERAQQTGRRLLPMVAIQTAASSAAHLTKYSNITDLHDGQKKLIVDDAIVPARAVFDYGITQSMGPAFTADGALDGVSHSLEVLIGAIGKPYYGRMVDVAAETIRLVAGYLEQAVHEPQDLKARTALGLATDLGGYAIMLGGTNGGHLTSFSLVDILSHGRACAIMNPYYVVFFAPAIEQPLLVVGQALKEAGLTDATVERLRGRELGVAVAEAMMELSQRVGFPTTLSEVPGFTAEHIGRALVAAKDPQLRMKLENMPVPLTAEMVDDYMGRVLEAARTGDLSQIRNVPNV